MAFSVRIASKEKTFINFEDLYLFVNVLSVKFGGVASFGGTVGSAASNLQKFSPQKFYLPLVCDSFPLYTGFHTGF